MKFNSFNLTTTYQTIESSISRHFRLINISANLFSTNAYVWTVHLQVRWLILFIFLVGSISTIWPLFSQSARWNRCFLMMFRAFENCYCPRSWKNKSTSFHVLINVDSRLAKFATSTNTIWRSIRWMFRSCFVVVVGQCYVTRLKFSWKRNWCNKWRSLVLLFTQYVNELRQDGDANGKCIMGLPRCTNDSCSNPTAPKR